MKIIFSYFPLIIKKKIFNICLFSGIFLSSHIYAQLTPPLQDSLFFKPFEIKYVKSNSPYTSLYSGRFEYLKQFQSVVNGIARDFKYGKITGFGRKYYYANTDFSYSIFCDIVNLATAKFSINFMIDNSYFEKSLYLQDSEFDGTFLFSNNNAEQFSSNNVIFNKSVGFSSTIFREGVVFDNSKFFDEVDFTNTQFSTVCSFSQSTFYKSPNFELTILPLLLHLNNINFTSTDENPIVKLDFRLSKLQYKQKKEGQKCKVKVSGSDLSKILLPFHLFEIDFENSTVFEEKISTYESIIKTCKDEGMLESAEEWDIEYKKIKNMHYYPILGRFFNILNQNWWNFGYSKWKILWFWLPLFFLIFFGINLIYIEKIVKYMYNDTDMGAVCFPEKERKQPFMKFKDFKFRFSYTLFYTASIYFGIKLRHDAVNYSNLGYLCYLFLIYLFGSIHMAFALSYILGVY